MTQIRAFFATRTGRLVLHDGAIALASGYAAWDAGGHSLTWGAALAAGIVAGKALLRLILPVPGKPARVYVKRLRERPVTSKPLGRHVRHDPRSKAFPFHAVPTTSLKSIRHTRHVPVFDQGQVGSCTGNAGAGALSTSPFVHRFTEHRALELYSAAEVLDGDGPYPPNDNGSSGLSIAKVCKAQGLIGSYSHCFTPDAVYAALQAGPVLVGVSWRTGFDTPAADGRMAYTGRSRGGHELCMDEIDVENQRVWVTNSWGVGWGVSGRAYWTWSDFAKILADQGDATVLDR